MTIPIVPVHAAEPVGHSMQTMLYVADAKGGTITAFALNPIGRSLEFVQRLELEAGVAPLTITPDTRYMYAMLRTPRPSVASLTIDPATGSLNIVATTPVANQLAYLQTDRSGKYLLGASYTDAAFAVHAIDRRGIVVEQPKQSTPTPRHAHCIVTDATNRFLFVTSLGGDVILQYAFDAAAGRATPNEVATAPAPTGSGPRHLTFHPSAGIVYVNGELDGSVGVYTFDAASGRLSPLQHVATMPPGAAGAPWAADIHLTPNGRYLYASERRTSTLAIFAVRAESGMLDRVQTVTTEAQPRSFAIDANGQFLFVAGERSHHLAMYEIDAASGELAMLERYHVGEKPAWVSSAALRS